MKGCVLIADSDKPLTDLCRRCLSAQGYRVETTSDGLECLEKIRRFHPDVLVLSLELLWGGGAGVLACLREEQSDLWPAVVLTFEDRSPIFDDEILSPPITSCLRKPFLLATLLNRVQFASTCSAANGEQIPADFLDASSAQPRQAAFPSAG